MTSPGGDGLLRFALIGCGDIGVLRAAALAKAPSCRLVAAADVDLARASRLARLYGGTAIATADWRDVITRPEVDAVIVSTPPVLHEEMVVAALEAGKHVLCEKPLARSPAEARRMVDAARRTAGKLATGFNYRFYPSFAVARELLDSGIIGELDHIRSYGGYTATSHNQPWVHDVDTVGGGALHDIGIHLIDLTRDFLGDVVEVSGASSNHVWRYPGCEDNGFALLRSSRGHLASVHASWTEWRRYQFRIEIYGSRGCIRATCFPMMTQVVWASERAGPTKRKTHLFPRMAIGEKLRSYRWVVVESFVQEFAAFAAFVRGETSRIATGEDGARALEIAATASRRLVTSLPTPGAAASVERFTPAPGAAPAEGVPHLSVVLLTFGSDGWPEATLKALVAQQHAQPAGSIEVLVPHDATLTRLEDLRRAYPTVRFIAMPGVRPPAELRATGAAASHGAIVAFLEGHAVPADDWCRRIMAAHAAPHAAIGGPIEKGLPPGKDHDSLLNWAVYLADYSRYMLPRPAGPAHSLSDCNVSYKRAVLERSREAWARELHENVMHDAIRAAGGTLWFDPGLVIHEQRGLRVGSALRDRFSFGRLFGSTRVQAAGFPRRLVLSAAALIMSPLLVLRVARTLFSRKRHRLEFVRSLPYLILISTAWMMGEAVGYLTGTAGENLRSAARPSTLEPA
jgi:predicted dehydrogenase